MSNLFDALNVLSFISWHLRLLFQKDNARYRAAIRALPNAFLGSCICRFMSISNLKSDERVFHTVRKYHQYDSRIGMVLVRNTPYGYAQSKCVRSRPDKSTHTD